MRRSLLIGLATLLVGVGVWTFVSRRSGPVRAPGVQAVRPAPKPPGLPPAPPPVKPAIDLAKAGPAPGGPPSATAGLHGAEAHPPADDPEAEKKARAEVARLMEAMKAALAAKDWKQLESLLAKLERLGPAAVPALWAGLEDARDPAERVLLLRALARLDARWNQGLGPKLEGYVSEMLGLAGPSTQDPSLRMLAMAALGDLYQDRVAVAALQPVLRTEVIPYLAKVLAESPDPGPKYQAIDTLASIRVAESVKLLGDFAIQAGHQDFQIMVWDSYDRLRRRYLQTQRVDELAAIVGDPQAGASRLFAAYLLQDVADGKDPANAALAQLLLKNSSQSLFSEALQTDNPILRWGTFYVLGHMNPGDASGLLNGVLDQDARPADRVYAVVTLLLQAGQIQDAAQRAQLTAQLQGRGRQELQAALSDKTLTPEERAFTLFGLGLMGQDALDEALMQSALAQAGNAPIIKQEAGAGMVLQGDASTPATLSGLATTSQDPATRAAATSALAQWNQRHPDAATAAQLSGPLYDDAAKTLSGAGTTYERILAVHAMQAVDPARTLAMLRTGLSAESDPRVAIEMGWVMAAVGQAQDEALLTGWIAATSDVTVKEYGSRALIKLQSRFQPMPGVTTDYPMPTNPLP